MRQAREKPSHYMRQARVRARSTSGKIFQFRLYSKIREQNEKYHLQGKRVIRLITFAHVGVVATFFVLSQSQNGVANATHILSSAAARWDKHARANDTTTARKISKESLGLRNNRNNKNKRKMLGVVPRAGWRFFFLPQRRIRPSCLLSPAFVGGKKGRLYWRMSAGFTINHAGCKRERDDSTSDCDSAQASIQPASPPLYIHESFLALTSFHAARTYTYIQPR